MQPLLVVVTVGSLVLAFGMAFVAWKLLRQNRERSIARIEALQAFLSSPASGDDDRAPESTPSFASEIDEFPSERHAPAIATAVSSHALTITRGDDVEDPQILEPEEEPSEDWPLPAPVVARRATELPMARRAAESTIAPRSAHEESWDLALRQRRPHAPDMPRQSRALATRSVPPEELFATPERRTPSHRWVALAGVGAVMAIVIGGVYAIYSTDILSTIVSAASGKRDAATTNIGEAPLELLSLKHSTETAGEFVVTGLVQNPPTSPALRGVVAVVYLFDKEGRYFASGKSSLDVPLLPSGGEAPFVIKVTAPQAVGRYRVGFRQEDGAVVAHVDRRGELPGGTTGDAVDTTPAPTATPVTRRSEG